VLGLLLLLHLVGSIQDSRSPQRRWELAHRLMDFQLPEDYELVSAIYAIHPHFFILNQPDTGQKIRVIERRWWAQSRTPEEFREKFWKPGQWIRRQPLGFGYEAVLVEATGELQVGNLDIPYFIGTLMGGEEQRLRTFVACLYDVEKDRSILVFSSASDQVFSVTDALEFTRTLRFPLK